MGLLLQRSLLYWRTARHLKASQWYWRLRLRALDGRAHRYAAPNPVPAPDHMVADRLRCFAQHWARMVPPDVEHTDNVLRGRFTFINKTVQSKHLLWRNLDVPKLWAYHLHYFDYARDVALRHPDPDSPEASTIRQWVDDWIEKNPRGTALAWDAYPLSARLLNWSILVVLYEWHDTRLLTSMHEQLEYLAGHLERDLLGNHLLKNAAAMTLIGALLDSSCGDRGLRLLESQVRAQFLPDGGHVERSPMYHSQALLDLLFSCAALEPRPVWLEDAVERALSFLVGMTHGDGHRAQFNDGAAAEGLSTAELLTLARHFDPEYTPAASGTMAFTDSGLYRLDPGDRTGLMLVKAGHSTVNYQPGHAHSDLLSLEYSLGNQRILVNSGTHGYAESPYLAYCRSCAAHNTLRINGQEQLEHWSTFRVARRIHGEVITWNPVEPSLHAVYTTLGGHRHERRVTWDSGGWCRVQDRVSGTGLLSVEAFLHFHPDCSVEAMAELPPSEIYRSFRISVGDRIIQLLIFGAREVQQFDGKTPIGLGWHFPRFGEALPSNALVVRAGGHSSVTINCVIAPCDHEGLPPGIVQDFLAAWVRRGGA